jgi:hypothetical protein
MHLTVLLQITNPLFYCHCPCRCAAAEYTDGGSAGVPAEVRGWFGCWMEKLDRQIGKELRWYRLRGRLAELRNAYEFGTALGADFDRSNDSNDSEDE